MPEHRPLCVNARVPPQAPGEGTENRSNFPMRSPQTPGTTAATPRQGFVRENPIISHYTPLYPMLPASQTQE